MNIRERAELGMLKHANHRETIKHLEAKNAKLRARIAELESGAAPERSGKLADVTYKEVGSFMREGFVYVATSSDDPRGIKLYRPDPADSSSAAPSDLSKRLRTVYAAYNGHGEELKGICDQAADELDRLAAPSPTGESLSEKPCVGCNGAGVIGTPGMPCPFCPVEKKLREFEAALVTPRQTSDPAAEDERLSKRIGATKGALASALRRPCVVKLEPGSSPSPFDPVFTTVTLDAEIPPPHQTEDGSGLSSARDLVDVATGVMSDWNMLDNYDEHETEKFCNALCKAFVAASTFAPKEAAVQGGVPEACEWHLDDEENGIWQSACGEAWSFIDGGPVENSVRYCQGCGKPVALPAPGAAK